MMGSDNVFTSSQTEAQVAKLCPSRLGPPRANIESFFPMEMPFLL